MSDPSGPTTALTPDTLTAVLDMVADGTHDLQSIADFLGVPRRQLTAWLTENDENSARYNRATALCESRRRERVRSQLESIAFMDPSVCYDELGEIKDLRDMPPHARMAIQDFEQNVLHIPGNYSNASSKSHLPRKKAKAIEVRRKIKFYSKIEALKLLGSDLKMFAEQRDIHIHNPYQPVQVPITPRLADPDVVEAEFTEKT